eukprot:1687991-Alexandrium_andersonii.AAC.1
MARSSSALSTASQTTARIVDSKSPAAIRMARAFWAVHTAALPQGAKWRHVEPALVAAVGGPAAGRGFTLGVAAAFGGGGTSAWAAGG